MDLSKFDKFFLKLKLIQNLFQINKFIEKSSNELIESRSSNCENTKSRETLAIFQLVANFHLHILSDAVHAVNAVQRRFVC